MCVSVCLSVCLCSILVLVFNREDLRIWLRYPSGEVCLEITLKCKCSADACAVVVGELAERFAELLRELWSGKHRQISPAALKDVVGRHAAQFQGFNQHDSQELLGSLLDGLHEDLNRIRVKPMVPPINAEGKLRVLRLRIKHQRAHAVCTTRHATKLAKKKAHSNAQTTSIMHTPLRRCANAANLLSRTR